MDKLEMRHTLLAAKARKKMSWDDIASAVGMSPVWVASACYGMNSASADTATVALAKIANAGANSGTSAQLRASFRAPPKSACFAVTELPCTPSPTSAGSLCPDRHPKMWRLNRADLNDLGDVMPQHIFDTHFQGRG